MILTNDAGQSIPGSHNVTTFAVYGHDVLLPLIHSSDGRHSLAASLARFAELTRTPGNRRRVALHLAGVHNDD
jgi:hypothetical protein